MANCSQINNTTIIGTSAFIYDSTPLPCTDIKTCDDLNTILAKLDAVVCNVTASVNTLIEEVTNITEDVMVIGEDVISINNQLTICCPICTFTGNAIELPTPTTTTTSSSSTSTTSSTSSTTTTTTTVLYCSFTGTANELPDSTTTTTSSTSTSTSTTSSTSTSTSTSSSTTTTTTTGFPCDCLTFENPDATLHNIGYTDCSNGIITGINIDPSEIISVCGSNGTVSDPLVTVTVGGVCIEGVCQTTTTTTTCDPGILHPYFVQPIVTTTVFPTEDLSLTGACSNQVCLTASSCEVTGGAPSGYINSSTPTIGDILYESNIGCTLAGTPDGYYALNFEFGGVYTIIQIVNNTIVDLPLCPA